MYYLTALGTSSKKGKPRTPTEYWSDTLRRTGVGLTPQTTSHMDSFSGLQKSQSRNMSYGSTSHFLRQRVGTEKTGTPRQQQIGTVTLRSLNVYWVLIPLAW
jgi:hypothetical protein